VRGDGGTQRAGEKNSGVREEKKRSPQDRGADGEMVIEMAGGCSKGGFRPAVFVEAGPAKTFVGMLIIFGEIEIMFNQRSANKSVIADPIAAHPGVEKRKREKEQKEQQPLRFARIRPWWGRDRKSTRLNSSHEWISYAVFCLKK